MDRCYRRIVTKIAIVYILTKDDWIIDRFLGMARKGTPKKVAYNFAHFCVSGLGENKRFVYSQVYQQTNWLQFQGSRPSVKSREKEGCHLRNLYGFEDGFRGKFAEFTYHESCDSWYVDSILVSRFHDCAGYPAQTEDEIEGEGPSLSHLRDLGFSFSRSETPISSRIGQALYSDE